MASLLAAEGYDLVRLVATGGMGEIYEVREHATRMRSACKLAAARDAAGFDVERGLELEAALLRAIRHPRIVAFRSTGRLGNGRRYLVMEWLAGDTLDQRLASQRPVALGAVARWLDELLDALAEVHRHGYVHGDVKPSNLLVAPDGGLRLIDFGAAAPIARGPEQAVPAGDELLVLGTPRYLAPERRRGLAPDARADLFSVGVLLGELLEAWQRGWPLRAPSGSADAGPTGERLLGVPTPLTRLRDELGVVARHARAPRWAERFRDAGCMQRALRLAIGQAVHTSAHAVAAGCWDPTAPRG